MVLASSDASCQDQFPTGSVCAGLVLNIFLSILPMLLSFMNRQQVRVISAACGAVFTKWGVAPGHEGGCVAAGHVLLNRGRLWRHPEVLHLPGKDAARLVTIARRACCCLCQLVTHDARAWDLHWKEIRPKAGAHCCQSVPPLVITIPAAPQIITVFLGSFIGGALFNQFNQWINDPASAITILGTAAPLTSIFFLTYIQLQVWLACLLSNRLPAGGACSAYFAVQRQPTVSSMMNTYIWQMEPIITILCRFTSSSWSILHSVN